MFKGTYRFRMDGKGRLPVPAVFRRLLAATGEDRVVVTILDQCLAAYPPVEWDRLEAQLRVLPAFNRSVKALTRLLASRAVDCPLDAQGRILFPAALRQVAGLGREAIIVGVLNRFEIWAPATWDAFLRDSERLLDDVTLEVQWPPPPPTPPAPPKFHRRPQAKPSR